MRFKLDENLPVSSAAILASAGHDVDTVGQEGLSGLNGAVAVLQHGLLRIRHP